MKFSVKRIDMESDGSYIVVLNETRAISEGIHGADRVMVVKGNKSLVAITNLSDITIKSHQIGVFEEVWKKLELDDDETVDVFPIPSPLSIEYIKKKIDGGKLSEHDMFSIIEDVVKNKLSRIELSAFVTGCYIRGLTRKEIFYLTKAVVDTGDTLQLNRKIIVDKHCLGGIPGNRTTMVVVPIVAAQGLTIPKTSSRSITSPAGTADTMEVLANVNLPITELHSIVEKTNGCIAFGGSVNLAAADDKLIKIRHPLHLDPEGLMLSSILAKKVAVGSTHVLIDIPIGPEAKTKDTRSAKRLGKSFKRLARHFSMKVNVTFTDGSQPIGNGMGPVLEARDVLKVLKQTHDRPIDLESKSLFIASEMMKMTGIRKSMEKASEILRSGEAYDKMKEIIEAQGGRPDVKISDLKPAKHSKEFCADRSGKVIHVSNHATARLGLACGAPMDKDTGLFLHHHVGEHVESGERLFTIYTRTKSKLDYVYSLAKQFRPLRIV